MKKYLPSKQFSIVIGSVIVICLIVFFVGRRITNVQNVENVDVSVVTTATELYNRDSDNDGLFDWEELLWKMDPKNPDTNGDGILDGQEVEQRRRELQSGDISADSFNPNTQTEALAQQFYLFAATNPNPSESEFQNFVDSVVGLFNFAEPISYISLDDVRVGVENPGLYYSDLSQALFRLQKSEKPADLVLIDQLLSSQNSAQSTQDMKNLIITYHTAVKDLQNIAVPSSQTNNHMELVNSLLNIAGSLQAIVLHFETDPTLAMSSVSVYDSAVEDFRIVMSKLTQYFQSNDII